MDPSEEEAKAAPPPKSETKGHGKQKKRLVDDRSELLALANAASGAQEAEVRDKLDKTKARQSSRSSGKGHEEDMPKKGKKSSRLLKMKADLAKVSTQGKSAKKRKQGGESARDGARKKAVSFA